MRQFFLAVITMAIPFQGYAQEKSYTDGIVQRCDGVIISCLYQESETLSGSCLMLLPNEIGGMVFDFKDAQVVEFGEINSESYLAGGDWTDIEVILNDFLGRYSFASWNGPDEYLTICETVT